MADADGGVDGVGLAWAAVSRAPAPPGHRWCSPIRRPVGRRESAPWSAAPAPLVGRAAEREALARRCALRRGPGGVVARGRAGDRQVAPAGRAGGARRRPRAAACSRRAASEFEADLPYALLAEALGPPLPRWASARSARLGLADPARSPPCCPRSATAARGADRHRPHRALRDLLARRPPRARSCSASTTSSGRTPRSLDALAALVRRPPAGAGPARPRRARGRAPGALAAALAAALREERVTRLALARSAEAEAARAGRRARARRSTRASGGNPFYLEQLARARRRRAVRRGRGGPPAPGAMPPAVAAALAAELAGADAGGARACWRAPPWPATRSSPASRRRSRSWRGGRAAGRSTSCSRAALVRPAGAPRRFAFRHPSCATRSTRRRPAAGGSAPTPAPPRRSSAAAPGRRAGASRRARRRAGRRGGARCSSRAARELQAPGARLGCALPRRRAAAAARRTARPARLRSRPALAEAQAAAGDPRGRPRDAARALARRAPAPSGWR